MRNRISMVKNEESYVKILKTREEELQNLSCASNLQ